MGKCTKCGRHGLFLKINSRGLCKSCEIADYEYRIAELKKEISLLDKRRADSDSLLKDAISRAEIQANEKLQPLLSAVAQSEAKLHSLLDQCAEVEKKESAAQKRIIRLNQLCKSAKYAMDNFPDRALASEISSLIDSMDALVPQAEQLNALTIKELRGKYRQVEKQIKDVCEKYQGRYSTKTNAALYKLMVLALQSEIQLILKTLCYGKLDDAISRVKQMTEKYYLIAAEGNQTIEPTVRWYIGQIENLYIEEVKLEYEYYIRRERAKEEQRVLREQIRQEAAERKELEQQRKKVEKEEAKYIQEIERLKQQLSEAEADRAAEITAQIEQIQSNLREVEGRKEEIITLQNGKAGTVYVISNLGSFGEDVFKIGMTRRLDPEDRVSELSSASVPFPFDVHSFIFSQDAVALESTLHRRLNDKRVNKVNLRKEFFHISLDELETMVNEIDPTAPFNRTMAAEQYRQSLSIDAPIEIDDAEDEGELDDLENISE